MVPPKMLYYTNKCLTKHYVKEGGPCMPEKEYVNKYLQGVVSRITPQRGYPVKEKLSDLLSYISDRHGHYFNGSTGLPVSYSDYETSLDNHLRYLELKYMLQTNYTEDTHRQLEKALSRHLDLSMYTEESQIRYYNYLYKELLLELFRQSKLGCSTKELLTVLKYHITPQVQSYRHDYDLLMGNRVSYASVEGILEEVRPPTPLQFTSTYLEREISRINSYQQQHYHLSLLGEGLELSALDRGKWMHVVQRRLQNQLQVYMKRVSPSVLMAPTKLIQVLEYEISLTRQRLEMELTHHYEELDVSKYTPYVLRGGGLSIDQVDHFYCVYGKDYLRNKYLLRLQTEGVRIGIEDVTQVVLSLSSYPKSVDLLRGRYVLYDYQLKLSELYGPNVHNSRFHQLYVCSSDSVVYDRHYAGDVGYLTDHYYVNGYGIYKLDMAGKSVDILEYTKEPTKQLSEIEQVLAEHNIKGITVRTV